MGGADPPGVLLVALCGLAWFADLLGVALCLVPPLTIALSAVLLSEAPPVLAVLGGLVCLVGVALSRRR